MNNSVFFGILLVSVTVFAANVDHGQPECMTEDELEIRIFQNFWDPTAFWVCNQVNVPGQLMRCQSGTAFQKSLKKCVSWEEWVWEAPDAPPNIKPANAVDEYSHYIEEEESYQEEDFDQFPVDETLFDKELQNKNITSAAETNESFEKHQIKDNLVTHEKNLATSLVNNT